MNEVLGFDCDGNEIEEFRILRFPFSADIENWEDEPNVDPRFYCIIKRDNGECVAVSVYDDYNSQYIRRYDGLLENEAIPMVFKTVSDMRYYETAFSGLTGLEWFYDRNRDELKNKIESDLFRKRLVKMREVK